MFYVMTLLMEEILHHLGCIKPRKYWDKLSINWCRISSINMDFSDNSLASRIRHWLILRSMEPNRLCAVSCRSIFEHVHAGFYQTPGKSCYSYRL